MNWDRNAIGNCHNDAVINHFAGLNADLNALHVHSFNRVVKVTQRIALLTKQDQRALMTRLQHHDSHVFEKAFIGLWWLLLYDMHGYEIVAHIANVTT